MKWSTLLCQGDINYDHPLLAMVKRLHRQFHTHIKSKTEKQIKGTSKRPTGRSPLRSPFCPYQLQRSHYSKAFLYTSQDFIIYYYVKRLFNE